MKNKPSKTLLKYFGNRELLIATMHGKEKLFAPVFEKYFQTKCIVPAGFNSDKFGTFTGEIERTSDPLSTARLKCLAALEMYGGDFAIASEGSFGPHPQIGFVPSDHEILVLLDKKNNIEIVAGELSTSTNFGGGYVTSYKDLVNQIKKCKFPTHSIILRPNDHGNTDVFKGIKRYAELKKYFNYLNGMYGAVYFETDMRAMNNPTRRDVIRMAFQKLLTKINSLCPSCTVPGYSVTEYMKGLPCSQCGFPTESTLKAIKTCQHCNHTEEIMYPNNKLNEDPMYCQICNP